MKAQLPALSSSHEGWNDLQGLRNSAARATGQHAETLLLTEEPDDIDARCRTASQG
ncbi:hypothetical protein HNP46_001828 [Pseudomonas nitritireducens]|uniref:Uncharacterized protein n=1 Tax=Pseudomonas nitroreducens TaxID=46680 RepID=A0A7W7KIZ1_PSENT|nr:hypothetical protein [Pseudomonas nitritireducens]MBB4862983.1 hypothetical protein [Pseudomonas nitritireducens]